MAVIQRKLMIVLLLEYLIVCIIPHLPLNIVQLYIVCMIF